MIARMETGGVLEITGLPQKSAAAGQAFAA